MKRISKLAHKTLCPLALVLLLSPAVLRSQAGVIAILRDGESKPARTSTPQRIAFVGQAEVKFVSGEASFLKGVERWESLRPGTRLAPGDLLRTGKNGRVILKMQSGSLVKMTPNTILRLVPFEKGMDPAVISGKEEELGFAVRAVRGNARLQTGEDQWGSLTVNRVLAEGVVLRIAKDGWVDLFAMSSGQLVRVEGEGELKLDSATMSHHAIKSAARPVLASTANSGSQLAIAAGR
jgi:hypothetical protein